MKTPVSKKRSASFTFGQSKKDENVGVGTKNSKSLLNLLEDILSNDSKIVTYIEALESNSRWKSAPNISLKKENIDFQPEEELIALEEECSEVVVDVESGTETKFGTVKEGESKTFDGYLRKVVITRDFWKRFAILPGKTYLMRQMEKSDSEKFSKMDVQSRRNFPIAFFSSLILYLLAFTYYLSDDIPF